MKNLKTAFLACTLLFLLSTLGGCVRFGAFVADRADRHAYGIVAETQERVLGEADDDFALDRADDALTSRLLSEAPRILQTLDRVSTPALQLNLAQCLGLAVQNGREYQDRREALFEQALDLTELRRDFHFIPTASGDAQVTRIETQTGDDSEVEYFGARGFALGLTKTFVTGARFAVDLTHDYSRRLFDDPNGEASAYGLGLSVVQPLLRGAGPLVVREPLRQGEREMVYAVREFHRFQKRYFIQITSSYFNLLGRLDSVVNAGNRYRNALLSYERTQAEEEADLKAPFEVDQALQAVLEAENNYLSAQNGYLEARDEFKIELGLPVTLDIGPDPADLRRLNERGLVEPALDVDEAVGQALRDRLDLKTLEDRVGDAERRIEIRLRDFLPVLDFEYRYSTDKANENAGDLDFFRNSVSRGGFSASLPLDWIPRRNRYRRALIDLDQRRRSLEESRDGVVLEVKNAWRRLGLLRKQYDIQQRSVALAQRRLERANLQLESGGFTTRDLLEAQDDLLNAQNAATRALVDYTIQRLRLWNAIEALDIESEGMWYE